MTPVLRVQEAAAKAGVPKAQLLERQRREPQDSFESPRLDATP